MEWGPCQTTMMKTTLTKHAWQMPPRYNDEDDDRQQQQGPHRPHHLYILSLHYLYFTLDKFYWPEGIPMQPVHGYTLGYFCCLPAREPGSLNSHTRYNLDPLCGYRYIAGTGTGHAPNTHGWPMLLPRSTKWSRRDDKTWLENDRIPLLRVRSMCIQMRFVASLYLSGTAWFNMAHFYRFWPS